VRLENRRGHRPWRIEPLVHCPRHILVAPWTELPQTVPFAGLPTLPRGQFGEPGTGMCPGALDSPYFKMFTARAMTSATVINEIADWTSIVSFAQRDSGMTSVGLNAVAFVNDM
jgi:hypothetical protein